MAAGQIDVARRSAVHYSKKESYHYRNSIHDQRSSRSCDQRIGRSYGYSSYLGVIETDGGRDVRGFGSRTRDWELGELSSRGRSNDAFVSGSNEISKFEGGVFMPSEKKRKLSPVVWDRDERAVTILSKNRSFPKSTPLCSLPSLRESSGDLTNVTSNGDVTVYPNLGMQISPVKSHEAAGSVGNCNSEPQPNSPNLLSPEQCKRNNQEFGLLEDEYVEYRHVSTSRWAYEEYSPGKICSDSRDISSRRRVENHTDLLNTPETGEFCREGSESGRGNSYASDGQHSLREPASRGDYLENDVDNDDFIEIDEKRDAIRHADWDLEDDADSRFPGPASPESRSMNMLQGCRNVSKYEILNKINEGTYGVVYKARDKETKEIVALKKVKIGMERDGFPLSSLREINILLSLHHPSVVVVKEVVVGEDDDVVDKDDDVFMAMEYMEHDLKGLTEVMKHPFSEKEVKCLMRQLLEGVKYLHDNWILHRDLKTSNLLLNNRGELKICDLGMSRQYGSPLKPYTPLVVTLWYRAPELLLGTEQYSTAVDMWSVGCIMAELLAKQPLFNGKTEIEQLDKIIRILGTPNETIWPGFSNLPGAKVKFVKHWRNTLRDKFHAFCFKGSSVLSEPGFDLLSRFITYDPAKRITAEDALKHR
ncbi:Cyclin-dependent kinase [Actinidia chinensis var. chinensis]|uniref:cyclin-dependent kinase n=1 Tax=Actinidia chinensis var. chinensis TaxID=1590841 RepID=A0A2R6PDS3_ACTCC|nr:Cyclin-dependent kinase [Actinidia chinensis var. chinensis]